MGNLNIPLSDELMAGAKLAAGKAGMTLKGWVSATIEQQLARKVGSRDVWPVHPLPRADAKTEFSAGGPRVGKSLRSGIVKVGSNAAQSGRPTRQRSWATVEWQSKEWFNLMNGRSRPAGFDTWMRPQQIAWLDAERPIQ